ncbi:hypothetical protein J4416_04240 [Candidatus Pacearchaeota archaeon]|nr:hypothetical protein [Candidatus Pacearchaeota archaeon]
MLIKEVKARIIRDSRNCETISVSVNGCNEASSPNGKSTGDYETPSYYKSLKFCVDFLNKWDGEVYVKRFNDLAKVEKIICKKLKLRNAKMFGANALYAFESAILKALAFETGKELFEVAGNSRKIPYPVGNVIGGGLHSSAIKKHPNFQEFLVIPKSMKFSINLKVMNYIYSKLKGKLKTSKVNDEGALLVSLDDKEVFDLINSVRFEAEKKFGTLIEFGIDAAASSFFKKGKYNYMDKKISENEQYKLIEEIILNYDLNYVEDPVHQRDFNGFAKIQKALGKKCLIVGDDLTATQYSRTVNAIQTKSINSIIIKPNQNGSLIELRKIFDLCKKYGIKTVLSHRSGETLDSGLADYAVGLGADYIKCGVSTKWREAKLNRLLKIEEKL